MTRTALKSLNLVHLPVEILLLLRSSTPQPVDLYAVLASGVCTRNTDLTHLKVVLVLIQTTLVMTSGALLILALFLKMLERPITRQVSLN